MGLVGEISNALDTPTRLPPQIRGLAPRLGKTNNRLTAAELSQQGGGEMP